MASSIISIDKKISHELALSNCPFCDAFIGNNPVGKICAHLRSCYNLSLAEFKRPLDDLSRFKSILHSNKSEKLLESYCNKTLLAGKYNDKIGLTKRIKHADEFYEQNYNGDNYFATLTSLDILKMLYYSHGYRKIYGTTYPQETKMYPSHIDFDNKDRLINKIDSSCIIC